MEKYSLLEMMCRCLFLFLTALLACKQDPSGEVETYDYFDLQEYLEEDLFKDCSNPLYKSVAVNSIQSDTTVTVEQAKQELEFLGQFSIDKPDYYGLYEIDTILTDGSIKSVQYKSINRRVKVKNILISYADNQIEQVSLHYENKNLLLQENDDITLSHCGVHIVQKNSPRFGKGEKIEIVYNSSISR